MLPALQEHAATVANLIHLVDTGRLDPNGRHPVLDLALPGGLLSGLPPPAEALRGLLACSNPMCENVEGDSEAGLPQHRCRGCSGAVYCSG